MILPVDECNMCDTILAQKGYNMTDENRKDMYELLSQARDLSADIVDFVQDRVAKNSPGATPEQAAVIKAALAVAFTTLCKATDTSMHDTIDMVMTIYKNTEVVRDDE